MLADDLDQFIRKHVRSLAALEILLLVHRTGPQAWSTDELSRELRSNPKLVADILTKLERSGLIRRDAEERYNGTSAAPELRRMVARLEESYATYPFAVRRAIYATPVEQIQALADAFKVRKE